MNKGEIGLCHLLQLHPLVVLMVDSAIDTSNENFDQLRFCQLLALSIGFCVDYIPRLGLTAQSRIRAVVLVEGLKELCSFCVVPNLHELNTNLTKSNNEIQGHTPHWCENIPGGVANRVCPSDATN